MSEVTANFRKWWQVPRKSKDRISERQVSFLELFYDLVYVFFIAELAHSLTAHFDVQGILSFIFLFILAWWGWLNGAMYHDAHGNNDLRTRVFTFLQMLTVIAMTIFAHDAMGKGSLGFAISYTLFLLVLTILWWRAGYHDKEHQALSKPYSAMLLVISLLFGASIFTSEKLRFILWGISLILSLLLPAIMTIMSLLNPKAKTQMEIFADVTPSLIERFGLFLIIVLGEVIVAITNGVSLDHLSLEVAGIAILGTLVAIALWWIYFDYISHKKPKKDIIKLSVWIYLHLPLTMSIVAIGSTLLYMLEHTVDVSSFTVNVFVFAVAIALFCMAALVQIIQHSEMHKKIIFPGSKIMVGSGILIIIVGLLNPPLIWLLTLVVLVLLAPVYYGLCAWMRAVSRVDFE